jgi:hypothetical protein
VLLIPHHQQHLSLHHYIRGSLPDQQANTLLPLTQQPTINSAPCPNNSSPSPSIRTPAYVSRGHSPATPLANPNTDSTLPNTGAQPVESRRPPRGAQVTLQHYLQGIRRAQKRAVHQHQSQWACPGHRRPKHRPCPC